MSQPTHHNIPVPIARSPQTMPEMLPAPIVAGAYPLAVAGPPARPAGPPALTAAPNATTLLHSFRRRWLLALAVALVGAATAVAGIVFFVPGQYTAEALIKVAPPKQDEQGEAILDYRSYRDSQQGILTSTTVLNAALHRPAVKDLPVIRGLVNPTGYLRSGLKVDFNASPFLMRVTLSGDNPEELKVLVNGVVEAFVDEVDKADKQRRKDLEDALRTQMERTTNTWREKTQLQRTLRAQRGLPPPEKVKSETVKLEGILNSAEIKLREFRQQKVKLENQVKSREQQIASLDTNPVSPTLVDDYLRQLGDLEFLRLKSLIAKEDDTIKAFYGTAANDAVAQVEAQPAAGRKFRHEQQLNAYRHTKESDVREHEKIALQKQIVLLQEDLTTLNLQQAQEEREVSSTKTALDKINALTVMDDDPLTLDIRRAKNDLDGMEADMAKLRKPSSSNITLLQRADTPQTLDRGRQFKLAGGAGLGVFVVLLLGVTLWEFRSRKINTSDEVVSGLGMEVVGTLPALPARARQPSKAPSARDLHWQSVMAESVDSVRSKLLHAARAEHLQVVMVTSAVGGEGKTSLASQLAASLARAWKKTLLIDGDLRNPAAHKLFDQPLEPGFSEVLRGEVPLEDVIRPAPVSRLWVMSAGQWDAHAVQALAQDGVRTLFEGLKEQYDFIVVDSCPVLPVADSLSLGQHVDAVVFSILRDVSRAPSVYAAQQRLGGLGVRILGAVVIGESSGAGSYQYPTRKAK